MTDDIETAGEDVPAPIQYEEISAEERQRALDLLDRMRRKYAAELAARKAAATAAPPETTPED